MAELSVIGKPIEEPSIWPDDGTDYREPVIDPNDNRVIRYVGWRPCLCCKRRFFSRWVSGIRLCDYCKTGMTPAIRVDDMTPEQRERHERSNERRRVARSQQA